MIILWVLIALFGMMTIAWVFAWKLTNPSLVDLFWPIGLMGSGGIYFYDVFSFTRSKIILALLMIWGVRLATYLFFSRFISNQVDKRYIYLAKQWHRYRWLKFYCHYQLQAIFIFIVGIPFFFAANRISLNLIECFGILICVIGFLGEVMADVELYRAKKKSNKINEAGLWHFSRHPNLFFDWLFWLGISFFAISSFFGLIALISPLMLYFMMTKMTIPITEKLSSEKRGETYKKYQERTNMFFPDLFKQHVAKRA